MKIVNKKYSPRPLDVCYCYVVDCVKIIPTKYSKTIFKKILVMIAEPMVKGYYLCYDIQGNVRWVHKSELIKASK